MKPRPDLLPWRAIWALGERFGAGVAKHGERGGRLSPGTSEASIVQSLSRHYVALMAGMTDDDHAAGLAANALLLMEHRIVNQPKETQDAKKADVDTDVSRAQDGPGGPGPDGRGC